MAKERINVSDQIRRSIDDCGMSRYQLSKLSGVEQSALARFMSGERGLSTKALDALGQVLDLTVVARRQRRS